ncbi:hypothetical protein GN958_ATG05119 [Phytophthora infestans]|uniref:Uncharacterized protein n=1 Tax=Phytophthora infestans TaxID=4787 RepID=A0A8S9UX54_PHYIN|nr:hypothetical protein GN958_ATG05119 [Phytophthora infestans]
MSYANFSASHEICDILRPVVLLIRSGAGDLPAGSLCTKKGDIAVQYHGTQSSYTTSSTSVAPQDAGHLKIKTGAWGCAFENVIPTPTKNAMDEATPAL